jgi:hypothetical protein
MSRRQGWIQAIHEMLRDGLAVSDKELREDDENSTCRPVRIHHSEQSIVVSLNARVPSKEKAQPICIKDRLFPLFREHEGVTRMCDYWILCEQGEETPILYVLLCELKSGRPRDGIAQLENAKLLADYFLTMVAHHQELEARHVEYRGLIFCNNPRAPKAGLKPGKVTYSLSGRLQIPVAFLSNQANYYMTALCT